MRYLRIIFLAVLVVIAPLTILAQGITKDSLVIEGKKRTYYLYVPASAKTAAPAPLLLLLHGTNRDGLSLVEKWKRLADSEGMILLGPNSADPAAWSVPRDGPQALSEFVEAIKSKYPINSRRVYLFGHSG